MYEMGRCQESGDTCPFCRGTDRGMKKDRIHIRDAWKA